MKAQIDKETLIKNRFWIGLGAAVLFVLIAFFCVVSVRGDADKLWNTADRVNQDLKTLQSKRADLRNDKWIARMAEETQKAVAQKLIVWRQSYDKQVGAVREAPPSQPAVAAPPPGGPVAVNTEPPKEQPGKILEIRDPFLTWPVDVKEMEVRVGSTNQLRLILKDLDFGTKIGIVPEEYKLAYARQFDELVKMKDLDLLNEKNQSGAMRVAGSDASQEKNLLKMLAPWPLGSRPVMSDEAWTLQEDFALKRDILKVIMDANRSISAMQPEWRQVTIPEPQKADQPGAAPAAGNNAAPPAGAEVKEPAAPTVLDRKRFYNTTWLRGLAVKEESKDEKKEPAGQAARRPNHLEWLEGWQLDLELAGQGDKAALKGWATNYSLNGPTPAGPLAVYLADDKGNELASPVLVTDAGNLAAATLQPNKVAKPTWQALKEVPAPKEAKKIARVQRVPANPELDHQRFFNQTWLVDLKLVPGQGGVGAAVEGDVMNRSGRMSLPAAFEVTCVDTNNQEVKDVILKLPKADPLKSNERREFPRTEIRRATQPKRIVGVRQILDWRSVPVKQINGIEFTDVAHLHSDRTRVRGLLRVYPFARKDPSPPAAVPGPTDSTSTSGGTGEAVGFAGAGGTGTVPPVVRPTRTPDHGVPLNRYYEVTDEVRRVPVAVVLVVDAPYMNDVLAAFANSRLRIQVTQVVWNRMPLGLPRPNFYQKTGTGAGAGAGSSERSPASPVGAAGAGGSVQLPGYPGLPSSTGGPSGTGGMRGPVSVEEETSEIEIQIYGLISLYESPDAQKWLEELKQKASQTAAAPAPGAGR
jgi:hypothetical protein